MDDLEPEDEMVVAEAIDGRRSWPSPGKPMPYGGAKPGDIWPRFSLESLKKLVPKMLVAMGMSAWPDHGLVVDEGDWRLIDGMLPDPWCMNKSLR